MAGKREKWWETSDVCTFIHYVHSAHHHGVWCIGIVHVPLGCWERCLMGQQRECFIRIMCFGKQLSQSCLPIYNSFCAHQLMSTSELYIAYIQDLLRYKKNNERRRSEPRALLCFCCFRRRVRLVVSWKGIYCETWICVRYYFLLLFCVCVYWSSQLVQRRP